VLRDLPRRPDPARLDRMVILGARALRAGPVRDAAAQGGAPRAPGEPPAEDPAVLTRSALQAMPFQLREAWILTRIDGLGDIAVSRAMDCSKSAMARHLAAADEAFNAALGSRAADAVAGVRRYADALDPGPFAIAYHLRRRRTRALRIILVLVAVSVVALGVASLIGCRSNAHFASNSSDIASPGAGGSTGCPHHPHHARWYAQSGL